MQRVALPYIFSEIYLVLCYLQRVTTRYHHFFKRNINIYFFVNLMVTRCKEPQTMLK